MGEARAPIGAGNAKGGFGRGAIQPRVQRAFCGGRVVGRRDISDSARDLGRVENSAGEIRPAGIGRAREMVNAGFFGPRHEGFGDYFTGLRDLCCAGRAADLVGEPVGCDPPQSSARATDPGSTCEIVREDCAAKALADP